ncbi:MAG: MFS transporter [Pseudomonadota bacterium]
MVQQNLSSASQILSSLRNPKVIMMLALGFSAGLPIMLIFSSLSLWLREAGLQKSTVTMFSWAALGYSFKFIWAPLVDRLPVPVLTEKLGRRRSWILVSQFAVMLSIGLMAFCDPAESGNALTWMAVFAVMLGFSSATQDIVIDAFRIESAEQQWQAMMSASYIAGYRVGMLAAGAGVLYLASWHGTDVGNYQFAAWRFAYLSMVACMLIGVVTTLLVPEPDTGQRASDSGSVHDQVELCMLFVTGVAVFIGSYVFTSDIAATTKTALAESMGNKGLASVLAEFVRLAIALGLAAGVSVALVSIGLVKRHVVQTSYVLPVSEFFSRYGRTAIVLLLLIGLYRVSDIVLGVVSNVFYQDLGYSKNEIATAVKTFGLLMSILGGFLGGALSLVFGVMPLLFAGAVLACVTNLLFYLLANIGYSLGWMYVVVGLDNLAAGLASAAFVAFLSALTNVRFTAVQFALFTSLMTLLPKVLGGYSGQIVDAMGYQWFFVFTFVLGLPVLLLVYLSRHCISGSSVTD